MSDTKELIKRMEAARDFPANTCGASRHAQQVAEDLLHRRLPEREVMEHAGESIAATVTALWEARTTIARLEAERDAARERADAYQWLLDHGILGVAQYGTSWSLHFDTVAPLGKRDIDATIRAAMQEQQ